MDLKTSYSGLREDVKLNLAVLNARLARLPAGTPHSLFLCLTYRCQLRCAHCRYRQPGYAAASGDMSPRLALRVLAAAAAAGIPRVILFGGEPSLYPGLARIVGRASRLGLFVEMDTNGLSLAGKKLSALAAAGLSAFRLSLHSASPARHNALQNSDSFSRVRRAADLALRSGFLVYLSSCLAGRAAPAGVGRLAALGRRWGAHGIRFLDHVPAGGGRPSRSPRIAAAIRSRGLQDYARTCFERAGAKRCAAQAGRTVFVAPDGAVRACPYAAGVLGSAAEDLSLLRRAAAGRSGPTPCCAPPGPKAAA